MNKTWALVSALLVLIVVYVVFFSDMFKKEEIQIQCTNMRFHPKNAPEGAKQFIVQPPLKIRTIMVAAAAEAATNKFPHALWRMTASRPVRLASFYYGEPIRGMAPSIPDSKPEPLVPGEKYRLVVETSGRNEGILEFEAAKAR